MMEQLIWATGILLLGAMGIAYYKYRDPLHPMMYLGPMLFYMYAFVPATLFYHDLIGEFFHDESRLVMAQTVNLCGLLLFSVGCLSGRIPARAQFFLQVPFQLLPVTRIRLVRASYALAAIGLGTCLFQMAQSGGLMAVYGEAKGGTLGGLSSGYASEAPLLTIPATMLYLLSQTGERLKVKTVALMLLFNLPHLGYAILGARRGPAFMVFATLLFGWYVARSRRPALRTVVAWLGGVGILMMFLISHRSQIYIGSDFSFDQEALTEAILPSKTGVGDTTVYAWGLIVASDFHHKHTWGRRYFTQLFIRPIPRQIWPTKYEDMGMGLVVNQPGSGGMTSSEWVSALGWVPDAGSAAGFIADAFVEFSWAGMIVCGLVGWFYGVLWKRSILLKGVYSLLYIEAAIVSVYIPTQSVLSAWFYRFLLLAAPTYLVWKWLTFRRRQPPRHVMPKPPHPEEDQAMRPAIEPGGSPAA
jgi:oligosaccharide repeat unit polymerase